MPMNAARTFANDDVFCEADAVMDRIKNQLLSTTSMTLSDATKRIEHEGSEMLRSLLQGYLQRCSDAEVPARSAGLMASSATKRGARPVGSRPRLVTSRSNGGSMRPPPTSGLRHSEC